MEVGFDSLPNEKLIEIFAHTGAEAIRNVDQRCRSLADDPSLYTRILELISESVEKHPCKLQIKQLFSKIPFFQDGAIPRGLGPKKDIVHTIFTTFYQILGEDTNKTECSDAFCENIDKLEWKGICALASSLTNRCGNFFPEASLNKEPLELRIKKGKELIANLDQKQINNTVLNLSKTAKVLLDPELLHTLPISSVTIQQAGLDEIPEYIFALSGLKTLALNRNPISGIPQKLAKELPRLLSLNISETAISRESKDYQELVRNFRNLKVIC